VQESDETTHVDMDSIFHRHFMPHARSECERRSLSRCAKVHISKSDHKIKNEHLREHLGTRGRVIGEPAHCAACNNLTHHFLIRFRLKEGE
jgi:hypothetical protein